MRIIEGYHALIAARVFSHTTLERMAAVVDIPIVNMLSDWSHPLQAFADALTMSRSSGRWPAGRWRGSATTTTSPAHSARFGLCSVRTCASPARLATAADLAELERLELLGAAASR